MEINTRGTLELRLQVQSIFGVVSPRKIGWMQWLVRIHAGYLPASIDIYNIVSYNIDNRAQGLSRTFKNRALSIAFIQMPCTASRTTGFAKHNVHLKLIILRRAEVELTSFTQNHFPWSPFYNRGLIFPLFVSVSSDIFLFYSFMYGDPNLQLRRTRSPAIPRTTTRNSLWRTTKRYCRPPQHKKRLQICRLLSHSNTNSCHIKRQILPANYIREMMSIW